MDFKQDVEELLQYYLEENDYDDDAEFVDTFMGEFMVEFKGVLHDDYPELYERFKTCFHCRSCRCPETCGGGRDG